MAKVTIEADAWVLETAARILQTYLDRGPSSDRAGVASIADQMLAVATEAQAGENGAG